MMNATLWIAVIGAVTGLTGAILGIINTRHALDRSKVKLHIEPKYYIFSDNKMFSFTNLEDPDLLANNPNLKLKISGISIHVRNQSEFAVTISEIGFLDKNSNSRFHLEHYFTEKCVKIPIRLEPRSSVSFYTDPAFKKQCISNRFKAAYVYTECGESSSKSCRHLKLHLAENIT